MGKMPCLVLGWQEFRMVMSTTTNIQSSSYKVLEIFFIILPAGRYIQT